MRVVTYLSAAEVDPARVAGGTAVVIDVIRATSTLTEALANGARAIYPTGTTEQAIHLANSLGREDTLLCGERKGLKVEGFDLGNSPGEFERSRVEGKSLVMSTTNGTRAFLAAAGARRVLAGSFLNLAAVAARVDAEEDDFLVVVCAGKEGRFSLDDALCAGHLIRSLEERGWEEMDLDDGSRASLALAREGEATPELLAETEAGRALVEVGLENDLELCAEVDRHRIVPEMRDRVIRVDPPSASGASEEGETRTAPREGPEANG